MRSATVGVVVLVHQDLSRSAQAVRHWAEAGCAVVVHIDRAVTPSDHDRFLRDLSDLQQVKFCARQRCEWGTWGIVAASQSACEMMLADFADLNHLYLASGSCLPIRPVEDLIAYLRAHPDTDFIESATVSDVPWSIGGLHKERFHLHFPFAWKRRRWLFDLSVRLQRTLGLKRRLPRGITPHLGSQWWCLTRSTISAILNDPKRPIFERYFRRVWIPDESYFQTLVRRHSNQIESRSLTLAKFDVQGKPHVFYDDHREMLRQSGCFVARKIWAGANKLYTAFPMVSYATPETAPDTTSGTPDRAPDTLNHLFAESAARGSKGRVGLYMQSRFPHQDHRAPLTAAKYTVLEGFFDLFRDCQPWLAQATDDKQTQIHGHLFAPEAAAFAGQKTTVKGGLSNSATLRDNNPTAFLTNLIWNTRSQHQCFQFGPRDVQEIGKILPQDPNAQIFVITGAWLVPLSHSDESLAEIHAEALRLHATEWRHLALLRAPCSKAKVHIWPLSQIIANPKLGLHEILKTMEPNAKCPPTVPEINLDPTAFSAFVRALENRGMHSGLAGNLDSKKPIITGPDVP